LPLPHPDNFIFDAAQGWLMLGDTQAALDELARLRPASRAQAGVAEFTWAVHAQRQDWTLAHSVAEDIVRAFPDRSFGWIHRAYALRRMPGGSLPLAWNALRPAADLFPKDHLIPYNLACYAAQLGRLDEAWDWLQRALSIGEKTAILGMALADADLEPLWPRLRQST
jgi:tetratricopeptide (TPR) repeat protein